MQGGIKKSRFSTNISQMMQDRAIVTMEGKYKIAPRFLCSTSFDDLE